MRRSAQAVRTLGPVADDDERAARTAQRRSKPKPATASSWDKPFDVDAASKGAGGNLAGHGMIGDPRSGFMLLRREALDDLWALTRQKRKPAPMTHQQLVIVLWLVTQAGWRDESAGVVLGTIAELASVLGARWHAVSEAVDAAARLGLLDRLVRSDGEHAGYRFTCDGYGWLAANWPGQRRPALLEAELAWKKPPARRPPPAHPDPFG